MEAELRWLVKVACEESLEAEAGSDRKRDDAEAKRRFVQKSREIRERLSRTLPQGTDLVGDLIAIRRVEAARE